MPKKRTLVSLTNRAVSENDSHGTRHETVFARHGPGPGPDETRKGSASNMAQTRNAGRKSAPARSGAATRAGTTAKAPVRGRAGAPAAVAAPAPEAMGTREAQRLATRESILRAASEGFARLGYEQCSLEEIACNAGVSKGLLLYHFDSKEELLSAVVQKVFEELLSYVKTNTAKAGPSLDQALWALDQAWDLITNSPDFLSIFLQVSLRTHLNGGATPEGTADFHARHRRLVAEGAAATLGPLQKVLPTDLDSLADILLATLFGLAIFRLQTKDRAQTERAYTAFRNVLKQSMGLK